MLSYTGGVKMPKRGCSVCGQEKDVYGGKECPEGHFSCKDCYRKYGSKCQLCKKRLR